MTTKNQTPLEIRCVVHVNSVEADTKGPLVTRPIFSSLEDNGVYKFRYDYPLNNPVDFEHELVAGMPPLAVLKFGKEDYDKIYAEEAATTTVPARDPQVLANGLTLMNRSRTNGKYGIWGHSLNDLFFEGIKINFESRTVEFIMGS